MFTVSKTHKSTQGLQQETPKPSIAISLLEIGSLPTSRWGSFLPIKSSNHHETVQKFNTLLKDVKDILKSVAGFKEKTTESTDSSDDVSTSWTMPERRGRMRGPEKANRMLSKEMFMNLDAEKEQNAKKQEIIAKSQNAKNTAAQTLTRDWAFPEDKRAISETRLSRDLGHYGSLHVREKYSKLRDNMEQLLQEVEHWSKQHTELSQLMKSYQKSQKERQDTLENPRTSFYAHPNNEASTRLELEAQVKKLSQDTHSLHLIAALLENQCQILQQRVEILKEVQQHKAATQEASTQVNCEPDKKNQKPAEADKVDKVENNKQNGRENEGASHKREKGYRSPDACLSKKARNNRLNARIARRHFIGRRRTMSSFR